MTEDIATATIESISFADIEALIGLEEGLRVEFKQALSTNDGRPDRWMVDQSRIGNVARDDIAKEIVAFANAYGGILIVGIEETDDNPRRAKSISLNQIPSVVNCAEQLERSLRAIIEPPLPMLEVRGVVSKDGRGVLLIRVNGSPAAPHGIGRPTAAYVRRGSSSEPLTMRDLQSIFYERRTRLERVAARREALRNEDDNLRSIWETERLKVPHSNQTFPAPTHTMFFRCSAVPAEDFQIDNLPDKFFKLADEHGPQFSILPHGELIDLPNRNQIWRRAYRSLEHVGNVGDKRFWKTALMADGSLDQVSLMYFNENGALYLHTYSAAVLQMMVLCQWMRKWQRRESTEYVLDAGFVRSGRVNLLLDGQFEATAPIPWFSAQVGPYSIGKTSEYPAAFDSIEREMWDLFGVRRQPALALKVKFEELLALN